MLPVMFTWVGCKHYESKQIYLVLWLKYKYCVTCVNMTLKRYHIHQKQEYTGYKCHENNAYQV